MQDLQPAVGEGADRLEVALAGGALLVVEGAGRTRERAAGPADQRLAQVEGRGYPEHRPPPPDPPHPSRRRVVRAYSWPTRRRGIPVRWEQQPESYAGLIQLARARLRFRYHLILAPWLRR